MRCIEGLPQHLISSFSQCLEAGHRHRGLIWAEKCFDEIGHFLSPENAIVILIVVIDDFGDRLLCGGFNLGLSLELGAEGCSGSEGEDDGFHLVVKCVFLIC